VRFYLLLSCAGSAFVRDSGATSLFNLAEELVCAPEVFGQGVPLETHLFEAQPGESGREVEVRKATRCPL
jgi:hypothetical protein